MLEDFKYHENEGLVGWILLSIRLSLFAWFRSGDTAASYGIGGIGGWKWMCVERHRLGCRKDVYAPEIREDTHQIQMDHLSAGTINNDLE